MPGCKLLYIIQVKALPDIKDLGRYYIATMLLLIWPCTFLQPGCFCLATLLLW